MYIKWTEEMIEYVRELYQHYTNKEIAQMLKQRYGITVRPKSLCNLHHKYKYENKLVNIGCFEKGFTPWNKDRKMTEEEKKKSMSAWFKEGSTPANTRPIGSMRENTDGYVVIKTKKSGRWTLYQRHIYEQAHDVKLGEDDIVLFADGNTRNFDVENLVRITREELLYLNQEGLISKDQDITKAGVGVARLIAKIRERVRDNEKSNS